MIESTEDNGIAVDVPNRMQPPEYAPADMQSLVSASFCPMDYEVVPNPTSPMTGFSGMALGAVDVFRHEGVGKRLGNRNSVHIREQWVDDFVISMPIDARVTTTQGGYIANLEPGGFVFLSTSRPFGAALSGANLGNPQDAFSAFLVRISGPLLREKVPHMDQYCGRANTVKPGAGQIMQSLFELAISNGNALSAEQRGRFGDMLLGAVVNVATELPDPMMQQSQRLSAYTQLRQQAMEYIHHHLSDPELDSRKIAAHCRISVRHLQAAFAASVTTVEAYIRESRLLQCRVSLKHPQLRNSSVIQIAMKWGFNDPAYFSRIYKARFGKPPSADRD